MKTSTVCHLPNCYRYLWSDPSNQGAPKLLECFVTTGIGRVGGVGEPHVENNVAKEGSSEAEMTIGNEGKKSP